MNLAKLLRRKVWLFSRKRCFSAFECNNFFQPVSGTFIWNDFPVKFCIVTIMEFSCPPVISSREWNQFGIFSNFWYEFIYSGNSFEAFRVFFFNLKFCFKLFEGTKIRWNFEYWFYSVKTIFKLIYLNKRLRFYFCKRTKKKILYVIYRSLSLSLNLIGI